MNPLTSPNPPRSVLLLVAVNLLPILGVLFLDWDVAALVVLYWAENLVIGAYNLLKMLVASGAGGLFMGLFFLIHYGGFCAVHGLFISEMMLGIDADMSNLDWPLFLVFVQLLVRVATTVVAEVPAAWLIAVLGLVISHGYSFFSNFIANGEKDRLTAGDLMSAPYKRIVILHIAVILGGFGVQALGQPLPLLVALVALKIVVDVVLHRREHRNVQAN